MGLVSPTIIAALLVGVVFALRYPGRMRVSGPVSGCAQAAIGVLLGVLLNAGALAALGQQWVPSLLTILAAMAFSVLVGAVLDRATELDTSTAMLGTVTGGAIGIVAMTRELGGDDRLVAFSQYLRLFVIFLLTPMVVTVGFGGGEQTHAIAHESPAHAADWLQVAGLAAIGWAGGRIARLPAAALLGSLLVTGAVTLLVGHGPVVPAAVREVAFALVGLDVGLRFTREALVQVRAALAPLMAGVAALLALSFGLALALDATTSLTLLDAYLATTPGGLTVVAATAYGAGANIGLVVGLQSVRTILMVALAPAAVRLAVRLRASR